MREDWVKTELQSLISFVIGGDWGKDLIIEDEDYDVVYCIRGAEFKNWNEDKGRTASLRKVKSSSINKRKLYVGDILLEISGGGPEQPVGRTVLIEETVLGRLKKYDVVCTNFLRLLRPYKFLDSKWINTYLKYFYSSGKTIPYQAGSNNLRNLKYEQYQTVLVPLAPLPEQRAIVAKIEELFSELDNGVANLNKAKEKLDIYRQAVLKKAFEGELTKEWREGRNDLKTGEETLTIIKNYRDANYESQIGTWKYLLKNWDDEGKIGMKPKKPSKLDVSAFDDYAVDFYTPKNWVKCQLADVLYGLTDYHANGSYEILKENVTLSDQEDFSVMIRATNFEKNDFSKDMKYIDEHAYNFLSKTKLHGGEILIGKIGNAGKVYLMPNLKRKASLAMNLFALIVDQKNILSKFLYYQLKNFYQEKEISSYVKGVGNPTIDKISIRSIHINLCSVEEQIRIVQEIEARLSLCDNIDICIKQGLNKANALRQSILKQAFEGKLLSEAELEKCKNESDWEPAEILLEKINNELRSAK